MWIKVTNRYGDWPVPDSATTSEEYEEMLQECAEEQLNEMRLRISESIQDESTLNFKESRTAIMISEFNAITGNTKLRDNVPDVLFVVYVELSFSGLSALDEREANKLIRDTLPDDYKYEMEPDKTPMGDWEPDYKPSR